LSDFLASLGGKLAERWLALLVLPGVFFLALATAAHSLGHAHALDLYQLVTIVSGWVKTPTATTTGGQIVLLVAVLAGAAGVGLAAQALGAGIERLTLAADWRTWSSLPRAIAARLTHRRHERWTVTHTRYHELYDQARKARRTGSATDLDAVREERRAAYQKRTRIALEEPDRPTWSGDRIHAATVRLDRDLRLNLSIVWPYLWTTLPESGRVDLTRARQTLIQSATLGAWALLYLPITVWWWPALPLSAGIALTARHRLRTAAGTYAQLLEATTRLHLTTLATAIGIPQTGTPTPALGATLTHHLHTQPPPKSP
jgi:hypothetical protein